MAGVARPNVVLGRRAIQRIALAFGSLAASGFAVLLGNVRSGAHPAERRVLEGPQVPPSKPPEGKAPRATMALAAMIRGDSGPYADLAAGVRLSAPSWLKDEPSAMAVEPRLGLRFRVVQGVAVEVVEVNPQARVPAATSHFDDADGDGIPTSLDILLGAKKTVLLSTPYVETYRALEYPNGDMPRNEGVCSDVVVRALRNAGYDLQSLIQLDQKRAPAAYPGIEKPDRNIDHRRVRNLLVYFKRHTATVARKDTAANYLPGDVLFFNTMGDYRPEHVGIVSDRLGLSGMPLIVNSWTTGYVTSEMDLLALLRPTHHFRVGQSKGTASRGER